MNDIETLVKRFESLPSAREGRWSVDPLVENRVYLTRSDDARNALFIVGPLASFGTYPKSRAIQHASGVVPVPGGNPIEALRLTSPAGGYGNRAVAHVAYEILALLSTKPSIPNADLVAQVSWVLELLSSQEATMPPDQQKGLIGELLLLRKLIVVAQSAGLPTREALRRWMGWDKAKRDFAAEGLAIEVKATALATRRHHIGSIDQLETHGQETIFLFSVGARLDPTAPRKLPDIVNECRQLLLSLDGSPDEDARMQYDEVVQRYGYDASQEAVYRALPGVLNFHLPPRFYRVSDLDRLRLTSFKGDAPPSMVSEVSYVLDVRATELSPGEEQELLLSLLRSPATGA